MFNENSNKEAQEKEIAFELSSGIDGSADPGKDFYQYAVGKQIENYPIPEEYGE